MQRNRLVQKPTSVLMLSALLLMLLWLGSACSNGAAPNASETRSFTAENGEVDVPVKPERIVLLAPNYAGYLLALGITPIAVPEFTLGNPYLQDELADVENLGATAAIEPSVEQIAALEPDLIIGLTALKNTEQLEKVAPVVLFAPTKNNREVLRDLGVLTQREEEAGKWLEQWDAKIDGYKDEVEAAANGKTFSIMYPSDKGVYMFREGYGRGTEILYGDFGLNMPERAEKAFEEGQGFVLLSLEVLPEMAGDYIFYAPWLGNAEGASAVFESEMWKGLPAVAEDRAFPVDYNIFTFSDPYSWEGQLEILMGLLLAE